MGCFSWYWLESVLLWLVVLCGVVAILRLLVPFILSLVGVEATLIMRVINIIIAVIVVCALIVFVFDVLGCVGLPGRR
jgi:hypothetical protein